jgi:hypothetical protein
MTKEQPPKRKTDPASRRAADAQRDIDFFAEKKAQEAKNLAKTEKLRALRLAHEAANPKPAKSKPAKPAGRDKKKK